MLYTEGVLFMSEETRQEETGLGDAGRWIGWAGIIAAVIGFFFMPFWLGGLGVVLGIIALFSPARGVAWWAIILGVIAIGIGFFFTPPAV